MTAQVAPRTGKETTAASTGGRTRRRTGRPAGRPTAWLAMVLGLVGVALGLGIGARHLQVAGMSLTAAVGLVGLVVGLVATAAGATVLVRGVHGWRRWLALPVGLLLVWFMAWPLTMAVMVTNVPPIQVGSRAPADHGIAFDDVTFVTADGVRLSAWYVPSRTGAAVVLRHGATSTRTDTIDELVVLARRGYGVLATDARGHGDSGGVAMDWGWFGDLDTAAAVTYLSQRPDVDADRVGVVGLSMGGEEALGAAVADPRVGAVVAEGVSSRGTVADDDLVLPDHVGRWMNVGQTWIQQHVADLLTVATPPRGLRSAVAAVAPRPVLLIVGSDALGGEGTAGPRLQAVAPDTVEVWEVAGASHIGGLATQPQQWETRVVGFLDRALR